MKKDGSWELIGYPEFHRNANEFAGIFSVEPRTMQRWAKKKSLDPTWEGPSTHKDPNKVQVFTIEEEENLCRFIDVYTHDIRKPMNNKLFAAIALRYYNYLKKTKASDGHVVNIDEIPWHVNEDILRTWAKKGATDIQIDGDEKECFTFIAGITFNGEKIPPLFIGKGKTEAVDKNWFGESHPLLKYDKIENPSEFVTAHSKKGWCNTEIWCDYLHYLRNVIPVDSKKI